MKTYCILWVDRATNSSPSIPCKFTSDANDILLELSKLKEGEKFEVHKCIPYEKSLEYSRI